VQGILAAMKITELRFAICWALPLAVTAAVLYSPLAGFLTSVSIFSALAICDLLVRNSPAPVAPSAWHQWVLRLYVPLHLGLIGAGLWAAASANAWGVLGLAYAVGFITGGQGITFAHELGHSKSRFDRFLGWVLMTSVCYSHFMVEHYRGHHPKAASYDDPASARYGESLWRFLPRTYAGSFMSAWRLEAQRLAQMRRIWLQSPLAWSYALKLALAGVLIAQAAPNLIAFWLLQSLYATWLLETVNYIEHYGLNRQTVDGKREPFGKMHAWNANHLANNAVLVNLQRHSDHHMHAWKPFATLEAMPDAPQLPTGYAGCVFLATVPPLWFKVMHPRLEALKRQAV
jgi:alkane 1-monooxygenase